MIFTIKQKKFLYLYESLKRYKLTIYHEHNNFLNLKILSNSIHFHIWSKQRLPRLMLLDNWPVFSMCSGNMYSRHHMSELLLVSSLATICHMSQILLVNTKVWYKQPDSNQGTHTVSLSFAFFCQNYLSHFNSDFVGVKNKVGLVN